MSESVLGTSECGARLQIAFMAVFLAFPARSSAAGALDDFSQNCAGCHTIGGGRLTGPDLKNVTKRRDREWLLRMIPDPKRMLESGDPTFAELYKEYRGVLMATVAGMNRERADALIRLIEEESKLEKSRFAGSQLINRPLLPSDVKDGEALFLGRTRLKNGGPACVSCHGVGAMSWLGGGKLGPDLTLAFSRLGGEKPLAAWLVAPGAPTMRPVYAGRPLDPAEILPFVAYLKNAALQGRPADSIARLSFLIIGLLGAAAMFVFLDSIWGKRLRSVRRRLVEKDNPSEDRDA